MRTFIDLDGNWYKAEVARDVSHMERCVVSKEFMEALSEVKSRPLDEVEKRTQLIVNGVDPDIKEKEIERSGTSGDTVGIGE